MAVRKKTTVKRSISRQLTRVEKKALVERIYSYLNLIDTYIEKKPLEVNVKSNLKKYRAALNKQIPYLSRL